MVALNFDARTVSPDLQAIMLRACNTPRPDLVDEDTIRGFCEWFHWFAALAIEAKRQAVGLGPGEPGMIQCMILMNHPDGTKSAFSQRFCVGDHQAMAEWAIYWSSRGYNVYVQARLVRNDLEIPWPKDEHTVQALALVGDDDGEGKLPTGIISSMTVQTSAKNRQHWLFMNAHYQEAFQIGIALRQASGMDSKTGCVGQFYRLPGTPNYPTKGKVENEDRGTEPTLVISWTGRVHRAEHLRELLPPCNDVPPAAACLSGHTDLTIEQLDAQFIANSRKGPIWLAEPTGSFCPNMNKPGFPPDRSNQFVQSCWLAFRAGISSADFHRLVLGLDKYRNGCAQTYLERRSATAGATELATRIAESARAFEVRQQADEQKRLQRQLPFDPNKLNCSRPSASL